MEPWAIALFAWVYLTATCLVYQDFVDDNPGEASLASFLAMAVLWCPMFTLLVLGVVVGKMLGLRK